MKNLTMLAVAALCLMGSARAETNPAENNLTETDVVLSQRAVALNVDISTARVRLSKAGYAVALVKVLVPELAGATLLDHRNEGEGAPCLTTYGTRDPAEVIQNRPAVEQVPFTVTLTKRLVANRFEQKCQVGLIESVTGKIRGFEFVHSRFQAIGERTLADCR
jgi:hypothetical protein